MSGFPRAHGNGPAGQFFLDIAGDRGGVTGDDEFLVLDLVRDSAFLHEHSHVIARELAGGPGGHDRQALGVLDKQPGRNPGALDFAGYDEVCQREVGGYQDR